MEDKFKCPRCGFEQPETEICRKCRIHIPRYIELQKRRRATPGDHVQRTRPRQEKSQDSRPAPEGIKGPPPESDKPQREAPRHHEPPEPPETEPLREDIGTDGSLTGIGNLFEKTWDIFKRRIGTLIVLYLFTIGLVLIPVGIFILLAYLISLALQGGTEVLIIAGSVVGATAGIIAGCWGFGSFLCAIADESLSIKDSLEKGGQKIWAFIWLLSLLGYIVPGGFFLFFIPGVLFMVWFAFAVFILPDEDEKGMNAVLKSKEYVKGHWVDVFARLFLIWLASIGAGSIPLIGPVLSILFFPFQMIFVYLIYEDLRSIKGDISYPSSAGEKFKWIGLATLGYIIVPITIIIFLGAAIMHSLLDFTETIPY
jgi:hypothetical protein